MLVADAEASSIVSGRSDDAQDSCRFERRKGTRSCAEGKVAPEEGPVSRREGAVCSPSRVALASGKTPRLEEPAEGEQRPEKA
jgi:hypothetical protein